jgi:Zn-finger protein
MFKKLFCKHEYTLLRTIHGDEIIHSGFKRSIWKCRNCKKIKFSDYLDKLKKDVIK